MPDIARKAKGNELLEAVGSEAHFHTWFGIAAAMPEHERTPYRGGLDLALHNGQRGVDSVLAERPLLDGLLKTIAWNDLKALPNIVLGALYAAGEVDRLARSSGATKALVARGHDLRGKLLPAVEALAAYGHVSARDVADIRRGTGPIDTAGDLVRLAAILRADEALLAKTPVPPEDVREAATVGTDLQTILRPQDAKTDALRPGLEQAIVARDALWSLVVARHAQLRRLGMLLWGDGVDAHVPALLSRDVTASAPAAPAVTE